MTTEDIFRRIVGALNATVIPYMLTSSFASSYRRERPGTFGKATGRFP
jgi:hypothetical protein